MVRIVRKPNTVKGFVLGLKDLGGRNIVSVLFVLILGAGFLVTYQQLSQIQDVRQRAAAPIDITAPTITISSPLNKANVLGNVVIKSSATDNVGVVSVEVYIDDMLKAAALDSSISTVWDTTTASAGSHTITAKAYDAAGNVSATAITVIK